MARSSFVIIGFGSQAKAWALNLRDSDVEVYIAMRKGSDSIKKVRELGFSTLLLGENQLKAFKNFALLIPDHKHELFLRDFGNEFTENSRILYAHGFSYCKGEFQSRHPHLRHLLLAPKSIASELRFYYESKGKLAAVISSEGSPSKNEDLLYLKEIALKLGINVGPFEATFLEETYADLFSEQTILCSLLPYGALKSYQKLVKKGISGEIAYIECWYELKLIAESMVKMGPVEFFKLISPNALFGGEKARKILFDDSYEKKNK
jgi:ketol-acid reductoisomerase